MTLDLKSVFLLKIYLSQQKFVLIRRSNINNKQLIIFNNLFLEMFKILYLIELYKEILL